MIKEWVFKNTKVLTFSYKTILREETWYKKHIHDGLELLYIYDGIGTLEISSEKVEIAPHTIMIIPPFRTHTISVSNKIEKPYIRSMFLTQPQRIKSLFEGMPYLSMLTNKLIRQKLRKHIICLEEHADEFENLLALTNNNLQTASPLFYEEIYATCFGQLLGRLEPYLEFEETGTEVSAALEVMEWIEGHMNEKVTLDLLSKAVGLSKYHLSHLFKEATGMTLMDYANKKKLDFSIDLLLSTSMSITEIGLSIGLKDPSYFCRWFKKQKGMQPLQFRKSHLQEEGMVF